MKTPKKFESTEQGSIWGKREYEFLGEIRSTEEVLNFEHTDRISRQYSIFIGEMDKDYLVSKGFTFSQTASTLTLLMQGADSPSLKGYTQSQLQP